MAPTEVKARLQSAKPKRRREEELDNEELEDDVRVFCAPVFYFARCPVIARR